MLTVESFPTDRRATALGIFIALSRAGALLGKINCNLSESPNRQIELKLNYEISIAATSD